MLCRNDCRCVQVLTIGATNLAQELDQALLRPGRFEVGFWCSEQLTKLHVTFICQVLFGGRLASMYRLHH